MKKKKKKTNSKHHLFDFGQIRYLPGGRSQNWPKSNWTMSSILECIAHALQSLMEVVPLRTLIFIDGSRAFDLISRAAMLGALRDVQVPGIALLFVRLSRPNIVAFVGH